MQVSRRTAARNGVAAGSVWESRMKIDEGRGGIKVFNGGESPQEEEDDKVAGLKSIKTDAVNRNRKTWKPEIEADPAQLRRSRSELLKKLAEDFNREKISKGGSRGGAVCDGNGDEDEDEENAEDEEEEMEMEKEIESIDIKEVNSAEDKRRTVEETGEIHQIHEIPISASPVCVEEVIHEEPISPFKERSVANKEKLQKIQAKLRKIHETPPTSPFKNRNVTEKVKLPTIREIPVTPSKRRSGEEKEKKLHQIHEMPISPLKPTNAAEKEKIRQIHEIPEYMEKQRSLAEKQKFYQFQDIPTSTDMGKKPPPLINHPSIDPDLKKPRPIPVGNGAPVNSIQETPNRLQSIADLVMWRDTPRSAFAFGLGTLILLSSSFIKDLNFSFVSATSYLGLFYLAAIFFYKSFLCRGAADLEGESPFRYMVGEEEAIWVLKLVLPYFNELVIKTRSLFCGDPEPTMKLAIVLYVLARWGNSVTIWTMARLAFFGVFTVPKFCAAYSNQITRYGKFWVQRFRDGWESCTHKKVVAITMITVLWNSSSIAARIWAVFMLIVTIQFHQQQSSSSSSITIKEEWCEEDSKRGQRL